MNRLRTTARLVLWCGLCLMLVTLPAAAQISYSVSDLYDFFHGGCNPGACLPYDYGTLTRWYDGRFYGTTISAATIFSILPDGAFIQTQFSFDQGAPYASLMLATDGNMYGTTAADIPTPSTIYRFTPPNNVQVLYTLPSGDFGLTPPVEGPDQNLYGATEGGRVYRITLKTGKVTFLPTPAPGSLAGPLMAASDGNMYGVTENGGAAGVGTVFQVTTTGKVNTIYSFQGTTDGANPFGTLLEGFDKIFHTDGYLYGTASYGGTNGSGSVFRISLSQGTCTPMASFDQQMGAWGTNTYGAQPVAGLQEVALDNFVGVTRFGGGTGNGTIFAVSSTATGWQLSKIYDFPGLPLLPSEGGSTTTLVENSDGNYYGLSGFSGTRGAGNMFVVIPEINGTSTPPPNIIVAGPRRLQPGEPVVLLGDSLDAVVQVTFAGGASANFQGTSTALFTSVPMAAEDGLITATLASGGTLESQQYMYILPLVTGFDPPRGSAGSQVTISGGGFNGATKVTFGGAKASFTVLSPNQILATIPARAKTGKVVVTTPDGSAKSKQVFTVD